MRILVKLSVILFLLAIVQVRADNGSATLTVKPNRCIGLQQGQTCFATLKFKWTTPASGEHCLFDIRNSVPLTCWTGPSESTFTQRFESNTNVNYEIRLKVGEETLAKTLVKVSWIYKSNTSSTSRWRLF